jgi:hypothetical protein
MTPENAHHVERYVLDPGSLTRSERRRMTALLRTDPAAQAWFDTLRAFYDELAREDTIDDRVDAFVDTLFSPPNVLELRARPAVSSSGPTVLAAEAPAAARYETVTALTARGDDVLVRVLRNRDTGEGRLYVITGNMETWAHALITFPEANLQVPVGAEGRAAVPQLADADTGTLRAAQVHRMLAAASLEGARLRNLPDEGHLCSLDTGHALRFRRRGAVLQIRCAMQPAEAVDLQYVVLASESAGGADHHVVGLDAGRGRLHGRLPAPRYTVRLYA